jgi:hypothetical protein
MFCKSCGNKIDGDSVFCSFCGIRQSDTNKPVSNTSLDKIESKVDPPLGQQTYSKVIEKSKSLISPKYDLAYEKEAGATLLGIILLIASLAFVVFEPLKFDSVESYNEFRVFLSVDSLVLRILVTIGVVSISKRQNREATNWGIFAFFLPSIALIIIGQLTKLSLNISIDTTLPKKLQVASLMEKARIFYKNNRFADCHVALNKLLEIDSENSEALKLKRMTRKGNL